jgi:hypothetical protein
MWGYPIWLYLGVWLVLVAQRPVERLLTPIVRLWTVVFIGFNVAFVVNYTVLPYYDHRYRAVFFPGQEMARIMSERYRATTGHSVAYVISAIWDGGLIEHYCPSHPPVLIDGDPRRAPWIDLADLKARGELVVWIAGDPAVMPVALRTLAADAAIQAPLRLVSARRRQSCHRLGDPATAANLRRCRRALGDNGAVLDLDAAVRDHLPCCLTRPCSNSNPCSLDFESSEPVGSSTRVIGGSLASALAPRQSNSRA